MTRIVQGHIVGAWVAKLTGGTYCQENSVAIALLRDEKPVAGVIFEGWNRKSIVCHMAIAGRITPEFLWAIADYAYTKCGVNKIIAPVWDDNAKMIHMAEKMGFILESIITDAQPTGDIFLYTLRKEDCRFLGERYGQTRTASVA